MAVITSVEVNKCKIIIDMSLEGCISYCDVHELYFFGHTFLNQKQSCIQLHEMPFRRVAYHTEQTANCGDGGDKYWQIMRGSASPERNGLGRVDISANEDRARNGARLGFYFNIKFIDLT